MNAKITAILGLLFLTCISQHVTAQMPCPDFDAAADVEKSASRMQEEALRTSLQNGPLARADVHFDIAFQGSKEAGIHARYLIMSYQLYLHMPPGPNRDFIERHLLISSASEIRTLISMAMKMLRVYAIRISNV